MAAESPVEMRQVGEAYFNGDGGDFSILTVVIGQQHRRGLKAFPQNVLRKGSAGLFEQHMNVARRNAQFRGDGRRTQSGIGNLI